MPLPAAEAGANFSRVAGLVLAASPLERVVLAEVVVVSHQMQTCVAGGTTRQVKPVFPPATTPLFQLEVPIPARSSPTAASPAGAIP